MPGRELGALMPRGVGLAGRVLESGRPVLCRYGDLPEVLLPELADNQVIGMPLRWQGELVGFFGVGARPPRRLQRRDQGLLALFGRSAAAAIVNARRFAETKRREARFALIGRVSGIIAQHLAPEEMLQCAADAVHELLQFPNVDIPLVDPLQPQTLVVRVRGGNYKALIQHEDRLPIATGIMGAAVLECRTQLVNDVAADPRYVCPPGVQPPLAELAVPIRLGHTVFGVINVEGDVAFDALDVSSLEVIAEHLALALNNAQLFDAARENAVLRERQKLAHELHDNVTQILASMQLLAQSLPAAWRRDPGEAERRSLRLAELGKVASGELRTLLGQLQDSSDAESLPSPEQAALPQSLSRLLAVMVPPDLELHLDFNRYRAQAPELELALYRLCQEAVSNAIRHARARRIEVGAAVGRSHVSLWVSDDGIGLPPPRARRGIGLSSMRERAQALNGKFRTLRQQPSGTRIEARVPRVDRS
jgi:signal transduction histidine kinase